MGKPERVTPERPLAGLEQWAGLWVAVRDGQVVASAATSCGLVARVRELGVAPEAVARYVPEPSDIMVIPVDLFQDGDAEAFAAEVAKYEGP